MLKAPSNKGLNFRIFAKIADHVHLSESHSFQANTSDDRGDRDRGKTPVNQSSKNLNFKTQIFK